MTHVAKNVAKSVAICNLLAIELVIIFSALALRGSVSDGGQNLIAWEVDPVWLVIAPNQHRYFR